MSISINYHPKVDERPKLRQHGTFVAIGFCQSTHNGDPDEFDNTVIELDFLVRNDRAVSFAAALREAADFLDPR